ncbi:MAG: hypothetical protein ABW086_15715 [Sedimenticola sp.]
MKEALRWCLQHTVILVAAVFILVGIIYRQAIFGIGTEDAVAQQAESPQIADQPEQIAQPVGESGGPESEAVLKEQVDPAGVTAGTVEQGDPAVGTPVTDQAEEAVAGDDTENTAPLVEQATPAGVIQETKTPDTAGEPAASSPVEVSGQADAGGDDKPVIGTLPSAIEQDALAFNFRPPQEPRGQQPEDDDPAAVTIEQARQAYWTGNEDAAIDLYRDLIKSDSENPDPYGELGNILLKQGMKDEAFWAFGQAVMLHKRAGSLQAAMELLGALEQVDQERSEKIRTLVQESGKPQDEQVAPQQEKIN